MKNQVPDHQDADLILAAEECPPETFSQYHRFTSSADETIIRKLSAHGPVLLRGGRGSGKSALLIEAHRRMVQAGNTFPVYVSLRYLPLLQSDGEEYIKHFCSHLAHAISQELIARSIEYDFGSPVDQATFQIEMLRMSQTIGKRIVLLFDDAAHIGREAPLEAFFDLFRTLSSNLVSCKASIYPGVTRFGVRFDVYNDSTVVDVSRADVSANTNFFPEVVRARYPKLAERAIFSDRLSPVQFANLLGRTVVGNLRGFILACNRFVHQERIGIPEIQKCMLEMATDYYWPLMEEVAPKLGIYEPLVEPARDVVEVIVDHASKPVKDRSRPIAPDRVLIHRQSVSEFAKIFEILEYLGFLARREASRALKSGGRGPVFALNLCHLLEATPNQRLTYEMVQEWMAGSGELAELHVSGQAFSKISLPSLAETKGLAILDRPVKTLAKSRAYPYGFTENLIGRLEADGIATVGALALSTDTQLDAVRRVGEATIKKIRGVVEQAIWM